MEEKNITKEYYNEEEGVLDILKAISSISETRRVDTDICIRLHGLRGSDFWFNAEEVIDAGGLQDYLASILDERAAKEILNLDFEIVDTDDALTDHFYGKYGTFDWVGYAEALAVMNESWMDVDAFVAGLRLGIPVDKLEDAYVGDFRNDEEYVEREIGTTWEIPEFIEPYIDWEAVARDNLDSFHSEDGHYFLTNY